MESVTIIQSAGQAYGIANGAQIDTPNLTIVSPHLKPNLNYLITITLLPEQPIEVEPTKED